MPDLVAALSHVADWFLRAGAADIALAHWRAADRIRAKHGFVPYQVWPLADVGAELERLRPGLIERDGAAAETVSADVALDAAISDLSAANISEVDSGQAAVASRHELTQRELEVLELVVAGRSNAEIGETLYISRKTASVHVANIKDKLGADSRIGIVTMALQRGLAQGRSSVESQG
jgi:DNA-binding CsgD family transcriptional regulator